MKDIHCSGAFSVCILVSTWDLSWARAGPDKYDTSTSSVCWVTDGESVCWCISTTVTTQPNFITWQRILQRLSMQVVRSSQADCHDLFAWLLRALKAADCRTKSSGFVVNATGRLSFCGTTPACTQLWYQMKLRFYQRCTVQCLRFTIKKVGSPNRCNPWAYWRLRAIGFGS